MKPTSHTPRGRTTRPVFVGIALVVSAGGRIAEALTDPIRLDSGFISGQEVGGVRVYKGIPFASPPVGALRWKPPRPVKPWPGVRACTEFGPWCPQPEPMLGGELGRMSEDCLFLNLWTPARSPADRLAVMVWIHGGGCTTGSGAMSYYNGEALARRGVVVVTVNYRLGPFGFLAHPLLAQESPHHVSGNYGLLDQIAALKWVRRNIAAFGGDPNRVTIFGESAGALCVCRLLVSPLARGLFHRAIAESGGVHGRNRHLRKKRHGLEPAEKVGERIMAALGCTGANDPVAALRAESVAEIMKAANPAQGLFGRGNQFGPVIDGWVLPQDPGEAFAAGRQSRVPFMVGSNADEGTVFLSQLPMKRPLGYRWFVRRLAGARAPGVLGLFPVEDANVQQALNKLITVAFFVTEARFVARTMTAAGSPTYLYHFTRIPEVGRDRSRGAFHGLEVLYVFGTFSRVLGFPVPTEQPLCDIMGAYWTQFAKTGNPNKPGLTPWPRYDIRTGPCLELGDGVRVRAELYREACDLFDEIRAARAEGEKWTPVG